MHHPPAKFATQFLRSIGIEELVGAQHHLEANEEYTLAYIGKRHF